MMRFSVAGIFTAALTCSAHAVTTVVGYDEADYAITGYPFVEVDLGISSSTALWDGLSSDDLPGYPKFPGSGDWPSAISPNSGNSTAVVEKVSNGAGGGAYPSSGSLYFGGQSLGDIDGGIIRAYDATPIEDVATVVFQIQIGDALVWSFYQEQMPTLSYMTVSGAIATISATYESYYGMIESPGYTGYDIGVRTYAFQWDLSGVEEEISEIWVSVNAVQHAQIYGMQLDEGAVVYTESILPASIPEPSFILLGAIGMFGLLARRRV
ncbi:PEP-CTERM sorting domain-containing protein [Luteolibacter pohnpeiensis]|uniref:PEP-CTERM sorting domain-containing protein n=1 Tax=Luteolibacter pohnpeiensis TaxID=454153 RepID=A0A934S3M4_9BACT|nr:PEP-CTERM sorting domain-containing protein [Luteolibacter pohnpeiensis]MBK1881293.1 PEP-CTERM sorting domain-containing protein [Luteolibacter pohnpeiensis]